MKFCGKQILAASLLCCAAAGVAAQNAPTTPSTFVTRFNLIGADALPPGLLEPYLSEHTMQRKTLAELRKLAAQLEKQLQTEHGLSAAKVWVPLQEDKLGVVDMRVVPGQIRQVRLSRPAQSDRETKALALLVDQFKPGSLLAQPLLEKTSEQLTKLLGETPRLALEPAPTLGQFDLILEPIQLEKYSLSTSFDNLGSRYTSGNRDRTQLQIRNTFFHADTLSFASQFLTPNQKTLQSRYDVPMGLSDFKLGISNLTAQYNLVDAYASLQAKGNLYATGIDLSNQLIRSQTLNLNLRAEAQAKRSKNLQAGVPSSDRRIQLFNLGLFADGPSMGGTSSANLVITSGYVDMSLVASDAAADTSNIAGRYQKINARFEQSIALGTGQRAQINMSVQRARKNLDSTESMLIGGISGVRAYPIGEAAADQGSVLNLELHHRWSEHWRGLVFYDHGWVGVKHSPLAGTTTANNYNINGTGFSVVWSPSASTEMAFMPTWKLRKNPGADATTGADVDGSSKKMRLWLFATHQF